MKNLLNTLYAIVVGLGCFGRANPQREVHAQFATVAWSIWYARNLALFQQKDLSHYDCLGIATRALWNSPICSSPRIPQAFRVDCTRGSQIKISSDASVIACKGVGIGVVMRDKEGQVLGCRYGFIPGAFSVIEGEALALLESCRLCRERNASDIILETDNQQLYWILQRQEDDLSYLGNILRQNYDLKAAFGQVVFSWTPREGNSVAHCLASFAFSHSLPLCSSSVMPSDVNSPSSG
ncbi:uncharacterized protein LOC131007888 [Salvia miltiorrhiza]|uniref:uncharacterized protein LOC131007888 n=1 Tax=Salvia miltiorrhiza TaxID=226208 RepID=UPI0025ABE9B2|nr:uncharacterized protein LOC131007888 [Salvia miltiorrhiza]